MARKCRTNSKTFLSGLLPSTVIPQPQPGRSRITPWHTLCASAIALGLLASSVNADQGLSPTEASQIAQLAQQGKFDDVLATLTHDAGRQMDPRLASLVSDLQRYHQHETDQNHKRQEANRTALDAVQKHIQEGKTQDALISAIEASNLADDNTQTRNEPSVIQLVHLAEQAADQAIQAGDWVEATNLFRSLDLLYDEDGTYKDRLNNAVRHLRVLRIYAPEKLDQLIAARNQRLSQEPPPVSHHTQEESWKDAVKNVEMPMFRQVIAEAQRRHIDKINYNHLLAGSIDSLLTLSNCADLAAVFPGLADPDKLARFRDRLLSAAQSLNSREEPLRTKEVSAFIDDLVQLNRQTIDLPEEVLAYEMTEGVIDQLDDFSAVIWPREKEGFSRNTQGKFYGVGIQISVRDDRLIVVSPLEGTPAHQAGIKAGDIIVSVDSRDTSTWTLDRAVREITGPKGTTVTLGVERIGISEPLYFQLTRAEIALETVRGWERKTAGGWNYFIDPVNRIGYMRVSQFVPQTAPDMDRAVNQMDQEGGADALILDLRFNPGGLLSSAVEVSDRFLASGPIVSTVGPNGISTGTSSARADHTYKYFPVVILVNEGSASASEIVSGALQDYQRAFIVGTRSFGKGSVQDLFLLNGEQAYFKLTTQYYQLPLGRIIHRKPGTPKWGIDPDLSVKMTTKQVADAIEFREKIDVLRSESEPEPAAPSPVASDILDQAFDPQLEAALLVLKTSLVAQRISDPAKSDSTAQVTH
jgi:carboxyl-terminal processing protease